MGRPPTVSDEEMRFIMERTLAGDSLKTIAKALCRSSKTICRCRTHLGVTGRVVSSLTEEEKDKIVKLARKGWSTNKIAAALKRSASSVLKVCGAAGIKQPKQLRGMAEAARLRALSFKSLGYSTAKVASIVGVPEAMVQAWVQDDLDAMLPKKRVSKKVLLDWIRVEDVDGTETWQCRDTLAHASISMREPECWLLLEPWVDGAFRSRLEALNAAKKPLDKTAHKSKR